MRLWFDGYNQTTGTCQSTKTLFCFEFAEIGERRCARKPVSALRKSVMMCTCPLYVNGGSQLLLFFLQFPYANGSAHRSPVCGGLQAVQVPAGTKTGNQLILHGQGVRSAQASCPWPGNSSDRTFISPLCSFNDIWQQILLFF